MVIRLDAAQVKGQSALDLVDSPVKSKNIAERKLEKQFESEILQTRNVPNPAESILGDGGGLDLFA